MVSAVHPRIQFGSGDRHQASKGLHMVSAVHLVLAQNAIAQWHASKGLHMVSAVHPLKSSKEQRQ